MEATTTGKPDRLSKSDSNQPSRKFEVILNIFYHGDFKLITFLCYVLPYKELLHTQQETPVCSESQIE